MRLWETGGGLRGRNLLRLAGLLGVEPGEIGEASPAESRVVPDGFDTYPSLSAFLEEYVGELDEHEVEHLRGYKYKGGDPGQADPNFWAGKLMEYRKVERLLAARGRDIAAEAPALDTGRMLQDRPKKAEHARKKG